MCKLGDIIVIKEFKNEVGKIIKKHSFVVINDEKDSIEGFNYDFVSNMLCSFHDKEHKRKKLKLKENLEVSEQIISNKKINNKTGYIKADQLYYFNKKEIEYYLIGKIDSDLLDELLELILELNNDDKLKIVITNLKKYIYN